VAGAAWLGANAAAAANAPEVKLTPQADRVRIEIGGQLFSEYIFQGAMRPYFYPVLAADGTQLNRDYPMKKDVPGEEADHPHHRSLWFTHGAVNGVDFWADGKGKIVHDKLLETKSGPVGLLRVRSRWLAPDGKLVCTDETTVRVRATAAGRFLDYEVTVKATPDAPLVFGDTKEGSMAMRVAQWMTPTHKYQKKDVPGQGRIVNSEGVKDAAAWGKRATWVDYHAPRNGKTYGVAMFDHPQNPRHPTWWHVRDYGLFAANPFGKHDFENLKNEPKAGDLTVPAGGSLTLRYRLLFHEGDTAAAKIADHFRDYAAGR
jgi:hypothetical protein